MHVSDTTAKTQEPPWGSSGKPENIPASITTFNRWYQRP